MTEDIKRSLAMIRQTIVSDNNMLIWLFGEVLERWGIMNDGSLEDNFEGDDLEFIKDVFKQHEQMYLKKKSEGLCQ